MTKEEELKWSKMPLRFSFWISFHISVYNDTIIHFSPLYAPTYTIISNAGGDGAMVLGMLLEQDDLHFRFDVAQGKQVDMVKTGIINPLKVVRTALLDASRPITLGEAFALARITEARFEDERATTIIAKPNDLNIAVQVQDIEETTLHTSDKVEVVSTSMVATYKEHGCQDRFCMVATYKEYGCQDGLKPVTTRSWKKGDLYAITLQGGTPITCRA
ncbi:reverse transcriptase [Tanacetum coccineum]